MSERLGIQKTYKLFIGGQFPRSESGRFLKLLNSKNQFIANVSRGSRKDFRNAVVAARGAFKSWSNRTAYNRGQILYRIAEMMEGRRTQLADELILQGLTKDKAYQEVDLAIDRMVYYAGWSDKYQQVTGTVNPVASSHFNFSASEAMGVIGIVATEKTGLLGLVSLLAPTIVGGNTVVILPSEKFPLSSITLSEVMETSDLPGGVVNVLTGMRTELLSHFASHMDVNALLLNDVDSESKKVIELAATDNLKRVHSIDKQDWMSELTQGLEWIEITQETKTTWHPIGL